MRAAGRGKRASDGTARDFLHHFHAPDVENVTRTAPQTQTASNRPVLLPGCNDSRVDECWHWHCGVGNAGIGKIDSA